jgi:DNA-3-methyladenine glycosylase I
MNDAGIVRNRAKIEATIANARAFLAVRREHRTFDRYIWQFVGGRPIQNAWRRLGQAPPRPTSRAP